MASSTGTGAGVFQTSPTITTPVISSLSSASATALTLQSAGTTAITVDTSQKVGIGTASPSTILQVSAATPVITVNSTGTTASSQDFTSNGAAQRASIGVERSTGGSLFVGSSAYAAVFGSAGASSTQFASNNTVRTTIDSSGNFFYSGASSATAANAVGTITFNTNGNAPYIIQNVQGAAAGAGFTFQIYRRDSSDVGNIVFNGTGVTFTTTSDYRLKENVRPVINALGRVAKLKPCLFNWKENGQEELGFIAHELQEEFPHAVAGEKDAVYENGKIKPQGIDTSFLVATLTAALQETKALLDTQAATINALTARIVALENR